MQYLVIVQTKQEIVDNPPADLLEVIAEEQAQGRALYASEDLRQSWEIDDSRPGIVCIYEAASEKELQALLDTYVMLQKGYGEVLLIKLKPDSAYVDISEPTPAGPRAE